MESRPRTLVNAAEALNAARGRVACAESEETRHDAIADVDTALEALLAAPSRTAAEFANKVRALQDEYGCDWQPRHVRALVADLPVFAS